MKHFRTSLSQTICGKIQIPPSAKLGLVSDEKTVTQNLIHDQETIINGGHSFTTASSKVTEDIYPDKYVIYLSEESINYSWVVENSIEIKIYELENNTLLAQKIVGRLDDISIMSISSHYSHPAIIIDNCNSATINLKDSFLKVEINSLCDNASNPKCDKLPDNVAVSGYDALCLPLTDFYVVPPATTPTTTPEPPEVVNRVYIDRQPTIITNDDITYYRVEADISVDGGDKFKYWWEKKDIGEDWRRYSELDEAFSNTTVFLKEPKEKDVYYRLLITEPTRQYSDSVFFNFPDPTTTTTTTLSPPVFSKPDSVTNVAISGGIREVYLSWNPPAFDGNSEITGYEIIGKVDDPALGDNAGGWMLETLATSTGVPASVSGYFQPVNFIYDGVDITYCVFSNNYFGSGIRNDLQNCTTGRTIALDPPNVYDITISPFRTSTSRGYSLDWSASAPPTFPITGHTVRYRPSGYDVPFDTGNYSAVETAASITGSFSGCDIYEIQISATNEIGEGPFASGFSRMAFQASAPTGVSYELLEGAANSFVEMSGSWYAPQDDGLCDIQDYVFSYRELPDGSYTTPTSTYNDLTFKTSDTLASGDYELRVAAITEAGTGVYGFYNPQTVFIYNFENNRIVNNNPEFTDTYPYFSNGHQITEDSGPRNLPAVIIHDDQPAMLSGGFNTAKFGNSGLYLSEDSFACPYDFYGSWDEEAQDYNNHYKFLEGLEINDDALKLVSSYSSVQTRIPLHRDRCTKFTYEFWFKIPNPYFVDNWETTSMSNMAPLFQLVTFHDEHPLEKPSLNTIKLEHLCQFLGTPNSPTSITSAPCQHNYSYNNDMFPNLSKCYDDGAGISSFGLMGQYVPNSGMRLIYSEDHAVAGYWYIDQSAPTTVGPYEVFIDMESTKIVNPDTPQEYNAVNLDSHGINMNPSNSVAGTFIPTSTYIQDNDWHHIALSVDAENDNYVTIYVDGEEKFTHNPTLNLDLHYDGNLVERQHHLHRTFYDQASNSRYYCYMGKKEPASSSSSNETFYDTLLSYGWFLVGRSSDFCSDLYGDPSTYMSNCLHFDDMRLSSRIVYSGEFDPPTETHNS